MKNAMGRLGQLHEFIIEVEQKWTVDMIINLFYSAAIFLDWLGDDKALFEEKVRAALCRLEPSGVFVTQSHFGVTYAVRN